MDQVSTALVARDLYEDVAEPAAYDLREAEAAPADEPLDRAFLQQFEAPADDGSECAWHLPPPGIHVTGTQLRKRLITPEVLAAIEPEVKPSLLQRLFRRK